MLTPYCAKVGSNTRLLFGGMKQGMIPVYIETLIMTNDDEGFEQLANNQFSCSFNGIYNFCHKVRFFNKLLMAKTEGILTLFSHKGTAQTLMPVKLN